MSATDDNAAQDNWQRGTDFLRWCLRTQGLGLHVLNQYHNGTHSDEMTSFALRAFAYTEARKEQPRELMFACAMHDYDHTGGASPDSKNIELALEGVSRRTYHDRMHGVNTDLVNMLIAWTEFDGAKKDWVHKIDAEAYDTLRFKHEVGHLSFYKVDDVLFMAKCMRDADVLATIFSGNSVSQLKGLMVEMQGEGTIGDFIEGNCKWLLAYEPVTEYGRGIKERFLGVRLEQWRYDFMKHLESFDWEGNKK
jgi:hypothetical protein